MESKFLSIIEEPSYWVEEVNNILYDGIVRYMEHKKLNRTEFAEYLGISKGRLSQILNSGEVNFSLEKLFYIALKIDKVPQIIFEDKLDYIKQLEKAYKVHYYEHTYDKFKTIELDATIHANAELMHFPNNQSKTYQKDVDYSDYFYEYE
ncbi:helix-turn-helix domain-containing protein [Sphingobacterium hungaricum]|uniref:DNA-binding protein n=1 Tax=Sphingobacterium hungaricum TaxID=2082723 RepID=A0A928YSI3_9SPHI|nr:helix-turn-helix transcriptional regulator [Sphingobacterium hungaricum]MBE8715290.1 DNA-binding protein [Sphingobacterium hungaricum]